MKTLITAILALSLIIAAPAFAKKPPWAGHGGRKKYQSENQDKTMMPPAMEENETAAENIKKGKKEKKEKKLHQKQQKHKKGKKEKKEKAEKQEKEQNKGLEKQRAMKAEQEQKELDKGSEQGQKSRQKRKKWWKFGQ